MFMVDKKGHEGVFVVEKINCCVFITRDKAVSLEPANSSNLLLQLKDFREVIYRLEVSYRLNALATLQASQGRGSLPA